ncbi:MAG: TetR/AcrR family transcriptional regulator [Prochlorothrix sp.]|nr:TetR/AcrR family transcriptional regulator [Prochlorothrix sp.]
MQKNIRKSTATQILDIAQNLLQSRGYSAFSYADISEQVGIRKASIHYHFPSKEDLVRRLIQYHRKGWEQTCDRICQSHDQPVPKLLAFVNLYRLELQQHQLNLGGMLAADFQTLSPLLQTELQRFLQHREDWLSQVLAEGEAAQLWRCQPSVTVETQGLLSLLQGAQLLARTAPDPSIAFDGVIDPILQAKYGRLD